MYPSLSLSIILEVCQHLVVDDIYQPMHVTLCLQHIVSVTQDV